MGGRTQDRLSTARALRRVSPHRGPLAADALKDAGKHLDAVQTLTLFALRALGVADARARGLVVQTRMSGRG